MGWIHRFHNRPPHTATAGTSLAARILHWTQHICLLYPATGSLAVPWSYILGTRSLCPLWVTTSFFRLLTGGLPVPACQFRGLLRVATRRRCWSSQWLCGCECDQTGSHPEVAIPAFCQWHSVLTDSALPWLPSSPDPSLKSWLLLGLREQPGSCSISHGGLQKKGRRTLTAFPAGLSAPASTLLCGSHLCSVPEGGITPHHI